MSVLNLNVSKRLQEAKEQKASVLDLKQKFNVLANELRAEFKTNSNDSVCEKLNEISQRLERMSDELNTLTIDIENTHMAVDALNEKLNEIDISKCTREELKSVADELSDAMESYVLSSTPRGPNTNAFEEKLNALELKLKELDTKHHDPPKIVFRK